MDIMNMNEKSPFLYNIIQSLCSKEEIEKKGGINAQDFISLLDEELDDISSTKGLEKIFSIFSDNNTKKISLPIFSQMMNQDIGLDLGSDEEKIKKLISRQEISGKEIDFEEFKDIMKIGTEEKTNYIYKKKPSNNSNNKRNKIKEEDSNNIKIKKDIVNPFSDSIKEISMNNKNYDNNNLKHQLKNNPNNETSVKIDEININNFDNINSKYESNDIKEDKNISKKKYRHMHESPKYNVKKLSYQEKMGNIKNLYLNKNNDKFDEKTNNINKEDKTEKRYHRRYRDIKSSPQKLKEEMPSNNKEEKKDKKVSKSYYKYRGKI